MANAKAEQGLALYTQGLSCADIATQLGTSSATVRSWKKRYGWDAEQHATPDCNAVAFPAQRNAKVQQPAKGKRGRKPTGKYDIPDMVEKIDAYLESTKEELPILKECCLQNDWNYDYVMQLQRQHEDLAHAIKKLLDWKEVRLERGGLSGKYDKTMVIFTLKQPTHGWRDKPIPGTDGNDDSVVFVDSEDAMLKYLEEHGDKHGG